LPESFPVIPSPIPEPATYLLVLLGLFIGTILAKRHRKHKNIA
jgi:uncharacterized membrane protein YsdA (DUF1294 family)